MLTTNIKYQNVLSVKKKCWRQVTFISYYYFERYIVTGSEWGHNVGQKYFTFDIQWYYEHDCRYVY